MIWGCRRSLVSLWLVAGTFQAATVSSVDHGEVLIDWLRSKDGFFHLDLAIRRQDDFSFEVFATEFIGKGDVLMEVPSEILISRKSQTLQVGNRIERKLDGTVFEGTITAISEDGTYSIAYDDGDSESEVHSKSLRMIDGPLNCETIRRLTHELKLGASSDLAPHVNYLSDQPPRSLPGSWSIAGKELLFEVLGKKPSGLQSLPPFDITR
jgi:hypothetical protein